MPNSFKVADDVWVIPESLPVPGVGRLPVNAMVIRGTEPMLVDSLAIVHRETFLKEVFNLVEPKDVKWLFLSHEDRDHSGSVAQIMERCPNAKLITNFIGLGKLAEEFAIPLNRVQMLNDGDRLDIGDRTITALRPPLYDSSATRGFYDPKCEVYFAADCFGVVCPDVVNYVDEMDEHEFEDGYFWMNRANHIWFEHIKPEAIANDAERIKALQARTMVSGHGPVERRNVNRTVDWIKRISDMKPVHMPDHKEFEAMLKGQGTTQNPPPPPGR